MRKRVKMSATVGSPTATTPADPAEAKVRLVKFWQEAHFASKKHSAKFSTNVCLDRRQPGARPLLAVVVEFDGNVEETFCRGVVVSYESFGAEAVDPVTPGVEAIPVTNKNREECVQAYGGWLFNKSIFDKFRSFKKVFFAMHAG